MTIPKITDAELLVMQTLWRKHPLTTTEVVASLDGLTDWKPKTIHTLLRRLAAKRAIKAVKDGREFTFEPLVGEAECQRVASQSFLSRFFGGDIRPFLARLVEEEQLSAGEIRDLKRILEGKPK